MHLGIGGDLSTIRRRLEHKDNFVGINPTADGASGGIAGIN